MNPDSKQNPNNVELPEPTGWPIIAAFGLTLLFAGLLTSLIITLLGFLICIVGFIGWFLDVFPHPRHFYVPVEQPPRPETSARSIQYLKIGERGHRMRLPIEVPPIMAGIKGGLVGAAFMAIMACTWGYFMYGSIWYPVNLLSAAAIPEFAEASTQTLKEFNLFSLIVATFSHGTISVMIGLLYITLLPMLPAKFAWFWGGIMTPLIWTGFLFATMRFVNPILSQRVDWYWFIACQVVFGMVCGYIVFKEEKVETMQSLSFAAKLGIEAPEAKK